MPMMALVIFAMGPFTWGAAWAWGLPLIVLTVLVHVLGLGMIDHRVVQRARRQDRGRHPAIVFAVAMGLITLLVTGLHGLEMAIWAAVYQFLGALPDTRSAILYSLNAMTSYGHTNLALEQHWQLMGAMEALNGWLLFGLTTAFLFGVIERVRSERTRPSPPAQ